MPAKQRGWARKRANGWQACWRDGNRQRVGPHLFKSKSEAEDWLQDRLDQGKPRRSHELSFAAHVERYLRVHAAIVDPATIRTLRERLGANEATETKGRRSRAYKTSIEAFGHLSLSELERMSAEIADWQTTLPPGYRHAIMRALRQVLNAALRWQLIQVNPANQAGPNPQPPRPEVAFFQTLADVDALAQELGQSGRHRRRAVYGPLAIFAVETGLRPSEWLALERGDIDRTAKLVRIRRTLVDGTVKEYGKTTRSRRNVPLTTRALHAVDQMAGRPDTDLLFPARGGGPIDLDNWRRREWAPALEAAGLPRGLTPYSMRHTYASFALDAGISIFELARLMGTSVKIIDSTYGHLVRDSFDRVRAALEERARREAERTRPR